MFSALVAQGTDNITYLTAVIVVALYAIAAVALSSLVLARRDVTS